MSRVYKLIVTDTSPLITLAMANELDVLLRAGMQIEIPDAVYIEATRIRTAPGANRIGAWINDHSELVRIVPTETGVDQQRRLEEGRPIRGMGEQAALETLDIFLSKNSDAQALLLFEDTDLSRRRAIVDERVSLISTGDFLRELQIARLIQSAEHILDEAARSGRNVEKQRESPTDGQVPETLRRQLQDRHRDSPGMER